MRVGTIPTVRPLVVIVAAFVLTLTACGTSVRSAGSATPRAEPTPVAYLARLSGPIPKPDPPATVPGGHRRIFPEHRLVGFVGGRSPAFGRLEPGKFDRAMKEISGLSAKYDDDGKKIMPVFELIAVIAHPSPTASGMYRTVEPDDVLDAYLKAARRHGAILLLNVQPGRSDFLDDVRLLERWLREPDVGLALDPEWAVGPDQVPGRVYGSTTGAELDSVASYLAKLVAEYDLPQKVMVFHQVHESVVVDEKDLGHHRGVAVIKSVDGIGPKASKEATWDRLMPPGGDRVRAGFKLFFEEDTEQGRLMTPKEVMRLTPKPDYVMYE